jgi:hypothetical protein
VLDLKLYNARYTNKTTSYTNEENLQRRTMVPVTSGSVVVIDNVQPPEASMAMAQQK